MRIIVKMIQMFFDMMHEVLVVLRVSLEGFANRKKITRCRNLGSKIVILGNGPSQDLYLENYGDFSSYDLLCVNYFPIYNREAFFELKPRYFCIVDPADMVEEEGRGTSAEQESQKLWKILEQVNWQIYFITYMGMKKPIESPFIEYIYINNILYTGKKDSIKYFYYEKNFAAPRMDTVAEPAILFAILFGFKEIGLFGIDHDNFKNINFNEDDKIYAETWHAYDKKSPKIVTIRDGKTKGHIYEIFEGYMNIFRAYIELEELAKKKSVNIINYNKKSYVDAFPKSSKYYKL